jgi:hypothetical protein
MKTDSEDRQWVLLEETYPYTVLLTKDEAEQRQKEMQRKFPYLNYTLFYDAYYEYSEILN